MSTLPSLARFLHTNIITPLYSTLIEEGINSFHLVAYAISKQHLLMKISTRNQFKGTVTSITKGAINAEVTITLAPNTEIVSVITNEALVYLDLKIGSTAYALIKSPSVIIGVDVNKISARNLLTGTIISLSKGVVNDEVTINLGNGFSITAIITKSSTEALSLDLGKKASAIIKASSVIIGVD